MRHDTSPAGPAHPRVSVVMPVFNVAHFVGAAVRSALGQTLRDLEVIAVDDGSTDDTLAVLEGVGDPRLRILSGPHHGPCVSLNLGVREVRGRYVAFLDGDDLWAENKLARHVEYMEGHPEADLTFSLSRMVDEDTADLGPTSRAARAPLSFRELLLDNVIGNGSSVVARLEALKRAGEFDPALPGCYDLDVWLRVALARPGNIHCLPEVLTYYRRRKGQLTKNWRLMQQGWTRLLTKMRRLAPSDTEAVRSAASSNMCCYFAYIAYENGSWLWSIAHLGRAFGFSPLRFPFDRRNYVLLLGCLAGLALPRELRLRLERAFRRTRGRGGQ